MLDEAQFVKNHQAKIYQCARRLPLSAALSVEDIRGLLG